MSPVNRDDKADHLSAIMVAEGAAELSNLFQGVEGLIRALICWYRTSISAAIGQYPPWLRLLLSYWLNRQKDRDATTPPVAGLQIQYLLMLNKTGSMFFH